MRMTNIRNNERAARERLKHANFMGFFNSHQQVIHHLSRCRRFDFRWVSRCDDAKLFTLYAWDRNMA